MGADIYLHCVFDKLQESWREQFEAAVKARDTLPEGHPAYEDCHKEVGRLYDLMYSEGYFRDSYNSTNMLNLYGLSWWRDIGPLLDEGSNLRPAECKVVLLMMDQREPVFEQCMQDILDGKVDWIEETIKETGETREEWVEYFRDKSGNWRGMLRQAMEIQQPLSCSI